MSEMALVYLVSSGAYSSYGINAVFSTLEKARAAYPDEHKEGRCSSTICEHSQIEVYTLDGCETDRRPWHVSMFYGSGDVIEVWGEDGWDLTELDQERRPEVWVHPIEGQDKRERFTCSVTASSKKQAIKAANERRAQHKALNA